MAFLVNNVSLVGVSVLTREDSSAEFLRVVQLECHLHQL